MVVVVVVVVGVGVEVVVMLLLLLGWVSMMDVGDPKGDKDEGDEGDEGVEEEEEEEQDNAGEGEVEEWAEIQAGDAVKGAMASDTGSSGMGVAASMDLYR